MSQIDYMQAFYQFETVLKNISNNTDILFFPIRIETHFRRKTNNHPKGKGGKELCVRIFPDELCLNYEHELSKDEVEDGKFFWMQWFIASGCRKREREAWDVLCAKYPVYRAAWICRKLRPHELEKYRNDDGQWAYRRPYPHMEEIEAAINDIYESLCKINFDETEKIGGDAASDEESRFEKDVREQIYKVKDCLFNIDRNITYYDRIVDYLYDEIKETAEYVKSRLEALMVSYQLNPALRQSRLMELWDVDYTILSTFRTDVDSFLSKLANKRITLDEMIASYHENEKTFAFFSNAPEGKENNRKWDVPKAEILPDNFFFIGEVDNKDKDMVYAMGNRVDHDTDMGLNPFDEEAAGYYHVDDQGNLKISGGLSWMVNYDEAERKGLAITVPLEEHVNAFKYIYVLGVKRSEKGQEYVEKIINTHNYFDSTMQILTPGIPTNLVEGGLTAPLNDEEEIKRRRFDIEVHDVQMRDEQKDPSDALMTDARILCRALGLNYNRTLGKLPYHETREWIKTGKAYKLLWDMLCKKYIHVDSPQLLEYLNFIGHFVKEHVRAEGNLPTFKVDTVPYGVLPVTDYVQLAYWANKQPDRFLATLCNNLVVLANTWKEIRKEKVVSIDNIKGADASKLYLKMAGQTPHSVSFVLRALLESTVLPDVKLNETSVKGFFPQLDQFDFFDAQPLGGLVWDAEKRDNLPPEIFTPENSLTIDELKNFICSATLGEEYSDEEKTRIVSGFLDIFTFRIDAWFEGILHYQLLKKNLNAKLSSSSPSGLSGKLGVGAYGWVFNLKENKREALDAVHQAQVENMMKLPKEYNKHPIYQVTGDDKAEFIVAPSVQHAISAAVLRSSYLRTKKNRDDAYLCVNLSSTRARQALRIIDGIKSGMSMGVVLGADFERYLHEAYKQYGVEMDKYIYPLRKVFPQTVDIEAQDARAHNYCMEVINGEALLNTFIDEWNYSGDLAGWLKKEYEALPSLHWVRVLESEMKGCSPVTLDREFNCLFMLVARMYDSYDALNDLLLSESVHRIVMGDDASYYAIGNFLSKGKGNLPEPEILNSPMDYVVVSHKVGLALPEETVDLRMIQKKETDIMRTAEPSLNAMLRMTVGSLDDIYFYVSQDGSIFEACSLEEIGMEPIEYLYLSSNEEQFARHLELCWRLKNHALQSSSVRIEMDQPFQEHVIPEKPGLTVSQNGWRMSQLRSVLKHAHALKMSEMTMDINTDAGDDAMIDIEDLGRRYDDVRSQLSVLLSKITRITSSYDAEKPVPLSDAEVNHIYMLLRQCADAGDNTAVGEYLSKVFIGHLDPIVQINDYREAIEMQVQLVERLALCGRKIEGRLQQAASLMTVPATQKLTGDTLQEAIKALLLNSFKIVPRIKDVGQSFLKSMQFHEGDFYANTDEDMLDDWLSDVAEVREGMKGWYNFSMYQIACRNTAGKVMIRQTDSHGKNVSDYWLGMKVDHESRLKDVDSLLVYDLSNGRACKACLIFDSWLEYIPYKKHDAGVVFHCDRPDNEAPQALLLAVNPSGATLKGGTWNCEMLSSILQSTRFMMMNRAVTPEDIYEDSRISALFPLLRSISLRNKGDSKYKTSGFEHYTKDTFRNLTILDMLVGGAVLKIDND